MKAAASELDVNVSTVARRLDALEDDLGQHLFDRSSEGTRPTAAAEELVPFAEEMERAALGFSRTLDGFESEPEGIVRVAAPPGLVDHFLAPVIADLVSCHPRIRIEVLSSIAYADLTRREADIALRAVRPKSGDLVATRLGRAKYTLLASPGVAKRLGRLCRLDDATWVTYGEELAHLDEVAWVVDNVSPERILLRANSLTAQIQAVRSGLGVKPEVTPFLGLDGLAEVKLAPALKKMLPPLPEGSLWLVGHRAHRGVPRIAAVWDFLLGRFREIVASGR